MDIRSQDYLEKLNFYYAEIRKITDFEPEIALVLGSGLGVFAEQVEVETIIPYHALPGFPVSTVSSHKGRFIFGHVAGHRVAVMQGRVHYNEGYTMDDVVLPTRLLGMLGAKKIILTNAAGGIKEGLFPGAFVALTDQISCFVPSPLIGNKDALGTRFPDMTDVYSPTLRGKLHAVAESLSIPLFDGVYLQTSGPNYESPAEIKMYAMLGADLVGMSTACEAIAARHMGMEICGISLVSNLAAGISKTPLTHREVEEAGAAAAKTFVRLLTAFLNEI